MPIPARPMTRVLEKQPLTYIDLLDYKRFFEGHWSLKVMHLTFIIVDMNSIGPLFVKNSNE